MNRIIYDSNCKICTKISSILSILDFFSLFEWIESEELYKLKEQSQATTLIKHSIVVITPYNQYITHFLACRYIAIRIPFLMPLIPFLYIPFLSSFIGERLYQYISFNRKCTTP